MLLLIVSHLPWDNLVSVNPCHLMWVGLALLPKVSTGPRLNESVSFRVDGQGSVPDLASASENYAGVLLFLHKGGLARTIWAYGCWGTSEEISLRIKEKKSCRMEGQSLPAIVRVHGSCTISQEIPSFGLSSFGLDFGNLKPKKILGQNPVSISGLKLLSLCRSISNDKYTLKFRGNYEMNFLEQYLWMFSQHFSFILFFEDT